jgi:hypothetical protein
MYDSVAADSSTKRTSDSQLTPCTVVFIKGSPKYELRGSYRGFLAPQLVEVGAAATAAAARRGEPEEYMTCMCGDDSR